MVIRNKDLKMKIISETTFVLVRLYKRWLKKAVGIALIKN